MIITFNEDTSRLWSKDPDYNLLVIRQAERWANDALRVRGFVGLYEIETFLGIPKRIETYNPNEHVIEVSDVMYACVLGIQNEVVFECFPQTNGGILISVNCGEYPIILKKES